MAAGDLCQLGDVKAWLALGANTVDDALLTRLISATSADFLAEIDRYDFFSASYTEIMRGAALTAPRLRREFSFSEGQRFNMRHWPITAVASIVLDGTTLPASTDGLAAGWWVDTNTDPENQYVITLIDYVFTRLSTATVTYTAGYAATPTDVTQAVIEWVSSRYRLRQGIGLSSVHIAEGRSQSEGASFVPFDVPQATQRIIDRYLNSTIKLMFTSND